MGKKTEISLVDDGLYKILSIMRSILSPGLQLEKNNQGTSQLFRQ